MLGPINHRQLQASIIHWLNEDMPNGDITSQNIDETFVEITGVLIAKEKGMLCGCDVFDMVFKLVDSAINIEWHCKDGFFIEPSVNLATIKGPLKAILMAERLALNLLQRMSGIATLSAKYAQSVSNFDVKVVDTRKTTPGLRQLEKYAVRTGGCYNHRFNLSDAVMIKDNHIQAAGSITNAVTAIRRSLSHTSKIEVEVESIAGLMEALDNEVDIIMLDNMDNSLLKKCVELNNNQAVLEASGNMTLSRLQSVAETGVNIISVGALTHSVNALDISLKLG